MPVDYKGVAMKFLILLLTGMIINLNVASANIVYDYFEVQTEIPKRHCLFISEAFLRAYVGGEFVYGEDFIEADSEDFKAKIRCNTEKSIVSLDFHWKEGESEDGNYIIRKWMERFLN